MQRSIAASSSWRSPVIAVKQTSETRSAAHRIENESLGLGFFFRCVEWKAVSVTAAEFYGAIIPSDLHVLYLSREKKKFPFYEPQFGRISLNILLSDSVFETKKLQSKVLNLTCRTIYVCKLLQNVKFDDFAFFTALVLYSQSNYFNYFNRDSNCGVLYESIEYTEDTFVRFGNNVCFENWK